MWSSWVKEKGTTHGMYIAKLKDGQKRFKKTFSMILERVFDVEVSFFSQNVNFPFSWKDSWSFSFSSSPLFFAPSLEDLGFDDIRGENHLFKNFFSNGFKILAVGAYSGVELCTPTWLNHDYGEGGVVDILAVDAYSGVELCTSIYLGGASK
jgi:hypothetical protein